jgi:hypothetical protein
MTVGLQHMRVGGATNKGCRDRYFRAFSGWQWRRLRGFPNSYEGQPPVAHPLKEHQNDISASRVRCARTSLAHRRAAWHVAPVRGLTRVWYTLGLAECEYQSSLQSGAGRRLPRARDALSTGILSPSVYRFGAFAPGTKWAHPATDCIGQ